MKATKNHDDYFMETSELENQTELNEIYYNCSECSSPIEIISINEKDNTIQFECIDKKHNIKISINKYLDKMKKFNDKNINNDICLEHNSKYESICFDCNKHLCKECLKTRKHINHQKINIIEIQPNEEEFKIIDDIIKKYGDNIKELQRKNTKRLIEIIFDTYNMFRNNYYNAININKIIINYYNNNFNKGYKNTITIKKEVEKIEQIIVDCINEVNYLKSEKEKEINTIKTENNNKINEYEKKIKESGIEYEKKIKELEKNKNQYINELNKKNNEIQNKIKTIKSLEVTLLENEKLKNELKKENEKNNFMITTYEKEIEEIKKKLMDEE